MVDQEGRVLMLMEETVVAAVSVMMALAATVPEEDKYLTLAQKDSGLQAALGPAVMLVEAETLMRLLWLQTQ